MYKLKDSLLFDDINWSNPFLLSVIISWEHLKRSFMPRTLCLFHNIYCNHPLWQAVCGWFEKIWRLLCFFEENHCSSSPLKVPIYATELVIIMFDDTHSFMINVLIRQALASVDFGTATFSHESCSFGVFSLPIIFFRCTVVFKNSYC